MTIIEPFKIKSVEPFRITTEKERVAYLEAAHYNPFLLTSDQVMIDFLTDSGTSAMSSAQWAGVMEGDESYAGARSWIKLEKEIRELTGFPYIIPTHQGRAAEKILYGYLGGKGKTFLSNTHFDTTRANIEYSGAKAIDCVIPEAMHTEAFHPFKGNADINKLVHHIETIGKENIPAIILTVTNNTGGGQPVSMENAKEIRRICDRYQILFILDACRIAENAFFINHREKGYENKSYHDIAKEMFSLADACIMSMKKDGLVNTGGFLAVRNKKLSDDCKNVLVIMEGFVTYGGMTGRDMEAAAIGLREVFDPDYLKYRIRSTVYLGENLCRLGVPIVFPVGGHAVYIDAKKLYPHIPVDEYPGQALVCELYKAGGIRCCEIGSVMFGKYDQNHVLIPAELELVRLAIPRRVYTQSHIDYVIEVFEKLIQHKEEARGLKIIEESVFLRHFTAKFEVIHQELVIS